MNLTNNLTILLLVLISTITPLYAFDYYEDLANATVLIKIVKTNKVNTIGSGVIINATGQILTCRHVTKDAKTINVVFRDDRKKDHLAKILKVSKFNDLSIIQIVAYDKKPRPIIMLGFDLQLGDDIYAIGHPEAHYWSIMRGIASNWLIQKDNTQLLQTDTPVTFGNSGGGVYNNKGELVGIVHAVFNPFPIKLKKEVGNTGIAYIIPVPEIIKFYLE